MDTDEEPRRLRQLLRWRAERARFKQDLSGIRSEVQRRIARREDRGGWLGWWRSLGWRTMCASGAASAVAALLVFLALDWGVLPRRHELPVASVRDPAPSAPFLVARDAADPRRADYAGLLQVNHRGWRRAVLLVGVSNSTDPGRVPLPSARSETEKAADVYELFGGVAHENIIPLIDQAATQAAVRAGLLYLRAFNGGDDLVIVGLSCHGIIDSRGDLRFQLYDSEPGSGLAAREIMDLLAPIHPHVLVVADACHAGALNQWAAPGRQPWIVAAAAPKQRAYEVPGERRSLFGSRWLEALAGQADLDTNDVVTLAEAMKWSREALRPAGVEQQPQLYPDVVEAGQLPLGFKVGLLERFPERGEPVPPPCRLRLSWGDARSVEVRLDGQALGAVTGPETEFPVAAGKHLVELHALTAWGSLASSNRVWSQSLVAQPGKTLSVPVSLAPLTYDSLAVCSPDDTGLFPVLEVRPDGDTVQVTWGDHGVLKVVMSPGPDPSGLAGAMAYFTSYRSVDVAALLGLEETDAAILSCQLRGGRGGEPVQIFCGGGDSLQRAASVEHLLPGDGQWLTVDLMLPAKDLHALKTGFGLRVVGGGATVEGQSLAVRDVRLRPAKGQGTRK
jgi:hypothetical protein